MGLDTSARNMLVRKPTSAATQGPARAAERMVPIISRNNGSLRVDASVPPIRLIPTAIGMRTRDFVENCAFNPCTNVNFCFLLLMLHPPKI